MTLIVDRRYSQLDRSDCRLDDAQTGGEKPCSVNDRHEDRVVGMIYDTCRIATERKHHCLIHRPIRTWPS
jgi:hypothetical protein